MIVDEGVESAPVPPGSLAKLVGRGVLWAVLTNVTMRVASVAVTALLARLLSKEDFGVFAVALAVYLIVSSLAELGMASAVARSAVEPSDIAPTVTSISILASTGGGVVMAVAAPLLASVLGQPEATQPIRILALCLVLTGVFAVPGAQLVREFKQNRIFLANVIGFLVGNPILILLAVNGGDATAFAWSRVIGQLATGLVFVLSTSHRYRPGWKRSAVKPLLVFGLPLSLANLVNYTLLNADYLILARLVDIGLVGVYMIAFNVANWSTAVMGSVLNGVVVPAFARLSHDRGKLAGALASACELVALVALPLGVATLVLARPLVTTVFGSRWSDAAPVLSVLSIYGVLYAFTLLFGNVLVAAGLTVRLLVIQLVWVAALAPAIIGGASYRGLEGAAWAHVVVMLAIVLPLYVGSVLRVTGQRAGHLLVTVWRPAGAAVVAGGAAWATSHAFATPWLALTAGGIAGGVVYVLGVSPILARRIPARHLPGFVPASWRASGPSSVEAP